MFSNKSIFANDNRLEMEGSFNLSAAAAVLSQSNGDGSTYTVTGQGQSVVKSGTGQYDVTLKSSNMAQGPVFQPLQVLYADATVMAATVATVLSARIASITVSAAGDIVIRIITAQTTGAAADTTAAITVTFEAIVAMHRMASPL